MCMPDCHWVWGCVYKLQDQCLACLVSDYIGTCGEQLAMWKHAEHQLLGTTFHAPHLPHIWLLCLWALSPAIRAQQGPHFVSISCQLLCRRPDACRRALCSRNSELRIIKWQQARCAFGKDT
jgi:hypothetical protein